MTQFLHYMRSQILLSISASNQLGLSSFSFYVHDLLPCCLPARGYLSVCLSLRLQLLILCLGVRPCGGLSAHLSRMHAVFLSIYMLT